MEKLVAYASISPKVYVSHFELICVVLLVVYFLVPSYSTVLDILHSMSWL